METRIKKILGILKIENISPGQYTMIEDVLNDVYEEGQCDAVESMLNEEYEKWYEEARKKYAKNNNWSYSSRNRV